MIRTARTLFSLAAIASASTAWTARAEDPLPKAEKVLDDYVEATGGKAAYEKITSRKMAGTLVISGANIEGKIAIAQAAPDKLKVSVVLGSFGETQEGFDGKTAWETNPLSGDKVFEGAERAEKVDDALFNSEIKFRDRYTKMECVGVADVDGKPAYKLELTPKAGEPTTEYYDKASKLLVKSASIKKGPNGEIPIETYPSDYKKVDGVLMSHKATQKVLTNEIVITLTKIETNVELPADAFAPPAEIKALLKDEKPADKKD